jgi:ketosteroid isomerase-like protein
MATAFILASSGQAPAASDEQHAAHLEAVRQFFELMHRKEIDVWAELWAEDGRIIVPYPPAGFGTSIDGKAAILTAFRGLFGNFESFDYAITGLYPAADSDAVCVEYTVRATLVGGTEYTNQNIAVFRFENGLIAAYHDYFDPRRFQTVVDALPK